MITIWSWGEKFADSFGHCWMDGNTKNGLAAGSFFISSVFGLIFDRVWGTLSETNRYEPEKMSWLSEQSPIVILLEKIAAPFVCVAFSVDRLLESRQWN